MTEEELKRRALHANQKYKKRFFVYARRNKDEKFTGWVFTDSSELVSAAVENIEKNGWIAKVVSNLEGHLYVIYKTGGIEK